MSASSVTMSEIAASSGVASNVSSTSRGSGSEMDVDNSEASAETIRSIASSSGSSRSRPVNWRSRRMLDTKFSRSSEISSGPSPGPSAIS